MRHFCRIFALSFLLIIISCGPKSDSPIEGSAPTDKKSDLSVAIKKSYRLDGWEGCSTTDQIIEARSSEELTKSYCERLQDGDANNSCAETQRLKLFIQDCPGQTWQPTESFSGIISAIEKRRKIEDSRPGTYPALENLNNLKIGEVVTTPGLAGADVLAAEKAIIIFHSCGFSTQCLMQLSVSGALSFHYFFWQPENVSALVVVPAEGYQTPTLNSKPGYLKKSLPLHIIFQYKINDSSQRPTVEVWREIHSQGFRSYKEFFADEVSSQKLLTITTTTKL